MERVKSALPIHHVGQVFLALAGASLWVSDRPDLTLQRVFQTGNWQRQPQHFLRLRPFGEVSITRIGLNLHAQIRILGVDIQTDLKITVGHGSF